MPRPSIPVHGPEHGHSEADLGWMREALALAEQAVGMASPNPTVGCVLVRDGGEVGRGAHHYDAVDHAERVALKQAGACARGATAYVTLEPCSHTGRTGPCADALIQAGVARVVVATSDPNPLVSGKGCARLREAGVAVTGGVLADEARALNDGFARHIRFHLPFVTLKAGVSLDGRIAPAATSPPAATTIYLTSPRSLLAVQHMRHAADAVLTGIGTALADNPLLTDRSGLPRRRPLLRVVVDSALRLALDSRLVESAEGDLLVYTADAGSAKADALRRAGAVVEQAPLDAGRLDLRGILAALGQRGILNLLVEGGSQLNRRMLSLELVDKLRLFYAPVLLGERGVPLLAGDEPLHPELQRTSVARSGDDFCLEAYLRDPWA
ncbi:MAG TPA: bifunctional diaminohydroxyphosphoribosylaminopyrimidine deaminase/5-amino-6-(5-phosphoribosylamino)uracil reductase RibD [Acidobacteriaceae bacterium]